MGKIKWFIGDELDLELGIPEKVQIYNEREQTCIYYIENIINFFIKLT